VISISLLVGTGVVYKQLNFMKSAGLGFNASNVVLIERANFLGDKADIFKQQVSKIPGVKQVTTGFSMPGTFFINSMWEASGSEGNSENLDYSFVDFDYTETLDIEIIAGRSFSTSYSTDSTAAIINEAAVQEYGWSPEEAIGKQLAQGDRKFTIVGVAKDFHYESFHAEIYPLALFGPLRSQRYVAARLSTEDVANTLTSMNNTWSEFSELPFQYSFLADNFKEQYRSEERLVSIFGVFAGLAILIGCMGLLGLVAFMASKRTKEIGIRKVLGATVSSIVGLLSKDFIKLVGLGFVIAAPIAWYAMNRWLADFAYRVEIGPGIFALAGGITLFIALTTVGWQSVRAALANPVESLRSE
jgi:putative ABC transport system permease protein